MGDVQGAVDVELDRLARRLGLAALASAAERLLHAGDPRSAPADDRRPVQERVRSALRDDAVLAKCRTKGVLSYRKLAQHVRADPSYVAKIARGLIGLPPSQCKRRTKIGAGNPQSRGGRA